MNPIEREWPPLLRRMRSVLRRDIVLVCFVIFLADVVSGILSPTFSVYARSLGASLSTIGALGSAFGFAQILASIPIGYLSDRVGRKAILCLGLVGWAVATALFALTANPNILFPGRVLLGLCWIATFSMALAYLGDIVLPEESGIAFGVFATAMGVGFAVGPLLSSAIIGWSGVRGSYIVAAILALGGAVLAHGTLRPITRPQAALPAWQASHGLRGALRMMRDPNLRAASLSNLIINFTFDAAIVNFFPLYTTQLHVPQAATNSMFSVRAVGSTGARFPAGLLTSRFSGWTVMAVALVLLTAVIFAFGQTERVSVLALLLVLEGVAYGVILTSGQALAAETSAAAPRGAAIGVYSMTGSVGNGIGPLVLGLVAEAWGVHAVFLFTAVLSLLGLLAIVHLHKRNPSPSTPLKPGAYPPQ